MKYKIGQICSYKTDTEVELALSGDKKVIQKGSEIIVGADKLAHHIRDGMIQPFPEGTEFNGYDTKGLAKYLFMMLKDNLPLDNFMEDYDIAKEDIITEIEVALDEIGF